MMTKAQKLVTSLLIEKIPARKASAELVLSHSTTTTMKIIFKLIKILCDHHFLHAVASDLLVISNNYVVIVTKQLLCLLYEYVNHCLSSKLHWMRWF
jgi:hypothetical protein